MDVSSVGVCVCSSRPAHDFAWPTYIFSTSHILAAKLCSPQANSERHSTVPDALIGVMGPHVSYKCQRRRQVCWSDSRHRDKMPGSVHVRELGSPKPVHRQPFRGRSLESGFRTQSPPSRQCACAAHHVGMAWTHAWDCQRKQLRLHRSLNCQHVCPCSDCLELMQTYLPGKTDT